MYKLTAFMVLTCFACTVTGNISQGIDGRITCYEGDRMPGIAKPADPGRPVKREVFIYSLTNQRDAVLHHGVFYDSLKTRLVKKTMSDQEGQFAIKLPPGHYSVFIKEEKGLYANRLDGSGNINPIDVTVDRVATMDIRIDYKAYY